MNEKDNLIMNKNFCRQLNGFKQDELDENLIEACRIGNIKQVQYLLTSPELSYHANIHHNNDYALHIACIYGHLDIIEYLLASPKLKDCADIRSNNYAGFKSLCRYGKLDILKFLFSIPKIKFQIPHDIIEKVGFKHALEHNQLNVIEYFVFELDLTETHFIKQYLISTPNSAVKEMFNIRRLYRDLENEMISITTDLKKSKM